MWDMTFQPPRDIPCRATDGCKVPARRQNILDKMSTIRSKWPDGPTRAKALELLQQDYNRLADACDHKSHADDWFEEPGVGYATDAYWRKQYAKFLCYNACPVRFKCLSEGFEEENLAHGTYGGLFAEERQAVVAEAKAHWRQPPEGDPHDE